MNSPRQIYVPLLDRNSVQIHTAKEVNVLLSSQVTHTCISENGQHWNTCKPVPGLGSRNCTRGYVNAPLRWVKKDGNKLKLNPVHISCIQGTNIASNRNKQNWNVSLVASREVYQKNKLNRMSAQFRLAVPRYQQAAANLLWRRLFVLKILNSACKMENLQPQICGFL